MSEKPAYRGIPGAFPYAFKTSDSWLFRSYVVVGTLATGLFVLVFVLAIIRLMGATAGIEGGSFTVSRAFFVLVGLFVVAPTVAPILLVARSRRREIDRRPGYEPALAVAGYLFLLSLYLGAVAAVPSALQQSDPGLVGRMLYALPRASGLLIPVIGASLIVVVHFVRR